VVGANTDAHIPGTTFPEVLCDAMQPQQVERNHSNLNADPVPDPLAEELREGRPLHHIYVTPQP